MSARTATRIGKGSLPGRALEASPLLFLCGELDEEGRAVARRALAADIALHGGDEVLHDGKTQPRAAHLARATFVHPVEALEDAREVFALDARAVVAHAQLDLTVPAHRRELDLAVGRRVLHRVVHQV